MKIALIGSAPSSVQLGPYLDSSYDKFIGAKPAPTFPPSDVIDETWEIWGVSPGAFAYVPRADRWFEVHRWEPGKPWLSPEYCHFLMNFRGPVYTGGVVPEIPNHVVYPIERVEAEFSAYFLHSSLSLMLAVAILEIEDARKRRAVDLRDYPNAQPPLPPATDDVIGLWGVDMAAEEEYGDQRSGCHFFILEALRRGIAIYTPPESCLLRPRPVYGLSEWSHDYIKATTKAREISARVEQANAQQQQAHDIAMCAAGERSAMNYFINTFMSPYGLPAGIRVSVDPGTGLGGGFTMKRSIEAHIEHMTPEQPVNRFVEEAEPKQGYDCPCGLRTFVGSQHYDTCPKSFGRTSMDDSASELSPGQMDAMAKLAKDFAVLPEETIECSSCREPVPVKAGYCINCGWVPPPIGAPSDPVVYCAKHGLFPPCVMCADERKVAFDNAAEAARLKREPDASEDARDHLDETAESSTAHVTPHVTLSLSERWPWPLGAPGPESAARALDQRALQEISRSVSTEPSTGSD